MSIEDCEKAMKSCFDANGNVIDQKKIIKILKNDSFREKYLTYANYEKAAKTLTDPLKRAAAEKTIGKAFPPESHWEMPDYYYPGIFAKKYAHLRPEFKDLPESAKLLVSTTKNDAVLEHRGWKRKSWDSNIFSNINNPEFQLVFNENESVSIQYIDKDTLEIRSEICLPFDLVCGIFLKSREMQFSMPKILSIYSNSD